jgi:hypothetical protein
MVNSCGAARKFRFCVNVGPEDINNVPSVGAGRNQLSRTYNHIIAPPRFILLRQGRGCRIIPRLDSTFRPAPTENIQFAI